MLENKKSLEVTKGAIRYQNSYPHNWHIHMKQITSTQIALIRV